MGINESQSRGLITEKLFAKIADRYNRSVKPKLASWYVLATIIGCAPTSERSMLQHSLSVSTCVCVCVCVCYVLAMVIGSESGSERSE